MAEIDKLLAHRTLNKKGGYMVKLSHEEGLDLAISILEQVRSKDCNTNRLELWAKEGKLTVYFSVAVPSLFLSAPSGKRKLKERT